MNIRGAPDSFKAFILVNDTNRYFTKEVDRAEEQFEDPRPGHSQKYNVKEDAIYANKKHPLDRTELRSYYRAGEKDPMRWQRNPFRWNSETIYIAKNEETVIEGIKAMVHEKEEWSPGGWLRWVIILVVFAGAGAALYFLWPYLTKILGV